MVGELNIKFYFSPTVTSDMVVAEFEKDDDSNGHIDFITAASVS